MRITIDIFDNDGKTLDQYTIVITGLQWIDDIPYTIFLCASKNPFHPQGIGMHCHEMPTSEYKVKNYTHLGKRIDYSKLPDDVKKYIAHELMPE